MSCGVCVMEIISQLPSPFLLCGRNVSNILTVAWSTDGYGQKAYKKNKTKSEKNNQKKVELF